MNSHSSCTSLWLAKADWPHLQNLNLFNINLTEAGLREVADARWPLLQSLNLSECTMGGQLHLLAKANWPLLRSLTLEYCQLLPEDGACLASLPLPSLQCLNLRHNCLGEAGGQAAAAHSSRMLVLRMGYS
jgi:hypothetical protein